VLVRVHHDVLYWFGSRHRRLFLVRDPASAVELLLNDPAVRERLNATGRTDLPTDIPIEFKAPQ
jgi:hypothetical protein